MNILIFGGSYILLSLVLRVIFNLFVLTGIFISQKKAYLQQKNNEEWNQSLMDNKGRKLYLILLYSYLISMLVMFPLSCFWFNFIGFKNAKLAALVMWLVFSIIMTIKLPQFKSMFQEKYNKYYTK